MPAKEERLRLITEWVDQERALSIRTLGERLGVSNMTLWRDLASLEELGLVTRVRGGVVKKGADPQLEPMFESKYSVEVEKKRAIGRYAADNFVDDDEIIILEGGTTVGSMVPYLHRSKLTVLTNNLNILVQAANRKPPLRVMSCGGVLREHSPTFVGPYAETFFEHMHAHKYFLGAVALSLPDGITDPDPIEIQVKRAMRKCAQEVVLMLDSSKFGKRSLAQIFPIQEINCLITDRDAPSETTMELRALGIDVRLVEYRLTPP